MREITDPSREEQRVQRQEHDPDELEVHREVVGGDGGASASPSPGDPPPSRSPAAAGTRPRGRLPVDGGKPCRVESFQPVVQGPVGKSSWLLDVITVELVLGRRSTDSSSDCCCETALESVSKAN